MLLQSFQSLRFNKYDIVSHVSDACSGPLITSGSHTIMRLTYCERARCIFPKQPITIPTTQGEMQLCPMICLKLIFLTCVVCQFGYQ